VWGAQQADGLKVDFSRLKSIFAKKSRPRPAEIKKVKFNQLNSKIVELNWLKSTFGTSTFVFFFLSNELTMK